MIVDEAQNLHPAQWRLLRAAAAPETGLDEEADTLDGYQSPLRAGQPEVHAASLREAELDAFVERVQKWIADGIEPHAIGVRRVQWGCPETWCRRRGR